MTTHLSNLLGAFAIGISDLQRATVAGAVDLDAAELSALLAVFTRPGSSVGDVALTTQLTHSGAVRVVDRLCAIALLERSAAQDRRTVALPCTQKGAEAAQRALDARGAALGSLIETLDPAGQEELARLATRLLAHLPHTRAPMLGGSAGFASMQRARAAFVRSERQSHDRRAPRLLR